jgi:hypothetical protein
MVERKTMAPPHADDMDDSLWDSPVKQNLSAKNTSSTGRKGDVRPSYEDGEGKEAALQRELASVRKVNEAIEGVVQNLERAKANMKV